MTQIEDTAGTTAEVTRGGGTGIELAITASLAEYFVSEEDGSVTVSLMPTPQQARALARQLLAQADASEYGE